MTVLPEYHELVAVLVFSALVLMTEFFTPFILKKEKREHYYILVCVFDLSESFQNLVEAAFPQETTYPFLSIIYLKIRNTSVFLCCPVGLRG